MPCHAIHALQHTAASQFGPLNQRNDFFRPSYRSRLYIDGTGKSSYGIKDIIITGDLDLDFFKDKWPAILLVMNILFIKSSITGFTC